MKIRARTEDDLPPLVRLATEIHGLDGYPPYVPGDDQLEIELLSFLTEVASYGAWVATAPSADRADTAQVVGHVALHKSSSTEVMRLAESRLGVRADGLAVVARLLVAPDARRHGIGESLLKIAIAECSRLGLSAILDVADTFAPAIALYERAGWAHLGTVDVDLPNGAALRERVYAAPRGNIDPRTSR